MFFFFYNSELKNNLKFLQFKYKAKSWKNKWRIFKKNFQFYSQNLYEKYHISFLIWNFYKDFSKKESLGRYVKIKKSFCFFKTPPKKIRTDFISLKSYMYSSNEFYKQFKNNHLLENYFEDDSENIELKIKNNKNESIFLRKTLRLFNIKKLIKYNRILLLKFLNIKAKRDYRTTRYIHRFLKIPILQMIVKLHFSIERLLLTSKLAGYPLQVKYLLENKCVFVNGSAVDCTYTVKVGDRIQILNVNILAQNFVFFCKNKKKFNQLSFRIWRLNRFKNHLYKTSSLSTPSWVYKLYNLLKLTPKYLEIDFFTQSCVVLYKPNNLKYFFSKELSTISPLTFRLYNWKYLT